MLAKSLFHTLMSNLERLEGLQALTEIGLPLSWQGRREWVTITITDQQQWDEILYLLVDACILRPEVNIDPYLTQLHSVRIAF